MEEDAEDEEEEEEKTVTRATEKSELSDLDYGLIRSEVRDDMIMMSLSNS